MINKLFFLLALTLVFIGCRTQRIEVYFDVPFELQDTASYNKFFDRFENHISNYTYFIDAGHGGEDRRSVGPRKLAVEADVNLSVALYLKNFLEEAGAKVYMTRTADSTVSLSERSRLANQSSADFFISIHHNAPGRANDNWTNYTSTFYHAQETDYEYEPMERDLARYIQRDLAYAMRNSGGTGSFDGTYSDYIIFPKRGFAVLRETNIPAVLVEGGFWTHHIEELRLIDTTFNKIQAWGIFRGIARYVSNSIPRIEHIKTIATDDSTAVKFKVNDVIKIDSNSITVFVDSVKQNNFLFEPKKNELILNFNNVEINSPLIKIFLKNINNNHSFPFEETIHLLNN